MRRGIGAPRERGAALLLALLILTLVASLAGGMVWQQQRAVQVEAAERARAQAAWVLAGALDWARTLIRDNARPENPDRTAELLGTPLAEARLSTFLAANRDGTTSDTTDGTLEAFLSGAIVDAQARYNLRNLVDGEGKVLAAELRALQRLCDAAGAASGTAQRIADGLAAALGPGGGIDTPLTPRRFEQLAWLGVDDASLQALRPFVTLLPQRSALNLNTASAATIAAVVEGLDGGSAERIVNARQRSALKSVAEARALLPGVPGLDEARIDVKTTMFEVTGRLRLEDRVLEERSLVERRDQGGSASVVVLWRDRYTPGGTP